MSRKDNAKALAAAYGSKSQSFRARNPHLFAGQPAAQEPAEVPAGRRMKQDQKPLMNKLEAQWLAILKAQYPTATIRPQARRYRLANGVWYKPDFVAKVDGVETAWEVKGPRSWRGGFENLKVAAATWHEVRWVLVWKDGGAWKQQEVLP